MNPDPTPSRPPLHLVPGAAETIREEIRLAGGREVCFLASVDEAGAVHDPRPVARGNREAVLAVARDAPEGGLMIHNHPSGTVEPSHADLHVASRLFQEGLGSAITDNEGKELYVVVEPPRPRVVESLDLAALEGVLAPDGALSRTHPGFEDRPGQRTMLRTVADRYHDGGVGVVEAGTGTGKSLAYLLPAASWALTNGERTVVSTATINLQEQLVGKDLPLVRKLLAEADAVPPGSGGMGGEGGKPGRGEGREEPRTEGGHGGGREVTWALVKGRGNYVSIRRALLAAESAADLFPDDRSRELERIIEWIESTEDGSLADLAPHPDPEIWEEVRSDSDICLRARCPHFQQCFFQRARREASSADLLVVNHHLLFADLSVRLATDNRTGPAVLPPFRHLVLDEAHNVEDAATSHLGAEVSRRSLFRTLSRLDRRGKGVLSTIRGRLRSREQHDGRALAARIDERVIPRTEEARAALERLMDQLEALAPEGAGQPVRLARPGEPAPVENPEVREALEGTLAAFQILRREVGELRERLELSDLWVEELEGRILDLRSAERRVEGASVTLRLVLDPGEEETPHVRWIERRGSGMDVDNLVLAAAPVEPGVALREGLFRRLDGTILTSATLATRGGFGFLRGRLGLGAEQGSPEDGGEQPPPVTEVLIPSPFDFASQTLLCVPTDMPGAAGGEDFDRATAERVEDFARVTGGGIFVLFTSYRSLRRVAAALQARGAGARHALLVHGEAPRSRLLRAFVESGDAVLLGTASFWEGVDVPGRPLRGLILQKLPFRVPTEPVTQAREEVLRARGENPFWSYSLPLAALRLKQGFGRLVRSRSDRGAVILLDDRILTRRYGRYLRDSLPDAPLAKGPWSEVVRTLEGFYEAGRRGVPLHHARG